MAVSLPTFLAVQVHLDGNVGPRWKKWLARFGNLVVGMGIAEEKQTRALQSPRQLARSSISEKLSKTKARAWIVSTQDFEI